MDAPILPEPFQLPRNLGSAGVDLGGTESDRERQRVRVELVKGRTLPNKIKGRGDGTGSGRHSPYEAENAVAEAALKTRTTAFLRTAETESLERDQEDADKAEQAVASAASAAQGGGPPSWEVSR